MIFSDLYGPRLDEELGNSDSTRLFTTDRRKFAINEGVRQFADLTECYVRESTISCSHGVSEYTVLSSTNGFSRLAKQAPEFQRTDSNSVVTYRSGDDFARTTVEALNELNPGWRNSTGGTPHAWYERMQNGARVVGVYPPPDITSSQTASIRLPYVAIPPTMTSDTEVPFTSSVGVTRFDLEPYHMAFVHYGAHQLEKLRVEKEASAQALQMFGAYVQRWQGASKPKGGTTTKPARSYFAESRRGRPGGVRSWPTDIWGDR